MCKNRTSWCEKELFLPPPKACGKGITTHTYLSKKDCGGPIRFMNFQQWILEIFQFKKKFKKIQNISTIKKFN
jgi:hypothetical protein